MTSQRVRITAPNAYTKRVTTFVLSEDHVYDFRDNEDNVMMTEVVLDDLDSISIDGEVIWKKGA